MKLYAKFVRFLGYGENKNEIHLKCRSVLGEDKDWSKIWVLEDKQQILWKNIVDAFKQEGETDIDCNRRLGIHFQIQYSEVFDSKMFNELNEPIELKGYYSLSGAVNERIYEYTERRIKNVGFC